MLESSTLRNHWSKTLKRVRENSNNWRTYIIGIIFSFGDVCLLEVHLVWTTVFTLIKNTYIDAILTSATRQDMPVIAKMWEQSCFPGTLSRFGITLKCLSVSDARPTPSWQRKTSTSPTPTSATSTGLVRTETVGGHSALTASCSTPTRRTARIPATSDTMFPTSARAERNYSGPSQVGFDRFYQRSLNARIPIISTMGAHT